MFVNASRSVETMRERAECSKSSVTVRASSLPRRFPRAEPGGEEVEVRIRSRAVADDTDEDLDSDLTVRFLLLLLLLLPPPNGGDEAGEEELLFLLLFLL